MNTYTILVKDLKGRDHLWDLHVDGLNEIGCEGVDWIYLAQDTAQLVSASFEVEARFKNI
jgi:hypothetical protein